jgi:glutaredoxin
MLALLIMAGCTRIPVIDPNAPVPEFADNELVVYTRLGCPYSEKALELVIDEGFNPDIRNVTESVQALQELVTISREFFPGKEIIVPLLIYNGNYLRGFNRQSILELLHEHPISNPEDYAYCE